MAQVAVSVAHVRTMEFAAGFLEAVTAPEVTMDQTVNTYVLLDFMVWIVLTSATVKMKPTVTQQVDSAFAWQVSMAVSVKQSVLQERLEPTAINIVTVKERPLATQ